MSQEGQLDNDPQLDELLSAASGDEGDVDGAPGEDDLDAMFQAVEARVSAAEARPGHWLRTRSTNVRRFMALGALVAIAAMTAVAMPPSDWANFASADVVLACVALVVLFFVSVFVAVRPLHVPELPRWQVFGIATLSVAATFVLAVTVAGEPMPHADHGGVWSQASPCMYFGLLAGVPVYALARALDRGAFLSPLLAAAAAGLAGNLVLQIHCPMADPMHNLAGHASVALLFVGGIVVLESLLGRVRAG